jgi:hypothetical protein
MIFGNIKHFGIECYHEPICNDRKWAHGRMCLWINNNKLGDINAPSCALCVTKLHLTDINLTEFNEFNNFKDLDIYKFLDLKLYQDDKRTNEQIYEDSLRYSRFNFLTNGGESFDRTKSFIVPESKVIRIIWRDEYDSINYGHIQRYEFLEIISKWNVWFDKESAQQGDRPEPVSGHNQ